MKAIKNSIKRLLEDSIKAHQSISNKLDTVENNLTRSELINTQLTLLEVISRLESIEV